MCSMYNLLMRISTTECMCIYKTHPSHKWNKDKERKIHNYRKINKWNTILRTRKNSEQHNILLFVIVELCIVKAIPI